ncbi:hypothetical protein LXL04_036789 [Taraxacum kok-saghyz]
MANEACSPGQYLEQDSNSAMLKDGVVVGKSSNNNISLRTGEEFSMEFLQDRGTKRINTNPNHDKMVGSKSDVTNHLGFNEISNMIGLQRPESMIPIPSVISSIPILPHRASDSNVVNANVNVNVNDSQRGKIKFLCSSGGKVLPRPSDGKLRYVGGETRIFTIHKNISFQELVNRTTEFCNQPHTIKYQLPGEDLDALISVSSNEDLQNMIEEYNGIGIRDSTSRLRVFLIPLTESEPNIPSEQNGNLNNPEYQYVAAVNGIDDVENPLNTSKSKSKSNVTSLISKPSLLVSSTEIPQNDPLSDIIEIPILKGRAFHSENRIIPPSHPVGPIGPQLGIPHAFSDPHLHDHGSTSGFGSQDASNFPSTLTFPPPPLPSELTSSFFHDNSIEQLDNFNPNYNSLSDADKSLNELLSHLSDRLVQVPISYQKESNGQNCGIIKSTGGEFRKEVNVIDENFSYPEHKSAELGHEESQNKEESQTKKESQLEVNEPLSNEALPLSGIEDEDTLLDTGIEVCHLRNKINQNDGVAENGGNDGPFNNALIAEMEAVPLLFSFNTQIIKNAELEELRELGSGTYGTVYHGRWRGSDVAIKRIKKSCFSGRSSEQERLTNDFWREARILSNLHHPNVVAFYGVVPDGVGGTLATVTEFMAHGSLRNVLIKKDRSLDRRRKLIIAMDAAFGMEYLHMKNIVHFDLKCDNLLVNMRDPHRPICKVGDFGLSRIKRNTLVSGGVRGTLPWMAPELLNGSTTRVSEKVDVFSFGITMWEILTGEEPYANMHCGAIIGGIVKDTLRPTIPERCDPEWKKLMEQCWAGNPTVRPSFTEITKTLRTMSKALQANGLKKG